jgi:hypothetical protein
MNMADKEKDLIGFANKVISFRRKVIKACRGLSIDVPNDEQISEYISDYGFNFKDFMLDYTEHEGMFRCLKTPLEKFKDGVANIVFDVKPTDEEILTFFTNYGSDVGLFCRMHTIKGMKPIVRKTYFKTIGKLSSELLVKLWNTFIEESALYGADSYIYDLKSEKDERFLSSHMDNAEWKTICGMASKGVRFVQWFNLNDGSINEKDNNSIENTIAAYWEEIFERIMLYPSCYNFGVEIYCKGDASTYFDDVFFTILAKEVGYIVDGDKGTIKEIEK